MRSARGIRDAVGLNAHRRAVPLVDADQLLRMSADGQARRVVLSVPDLAGSPLGGGCCAVSRDDMLLEELDSWPGLLAWTSTQTRRPSSCSSPRAATTCPRRWTPSPSEACPPPWWRTATRLVRDAPSPLAGGASQCCADGSVVSARVARGAAPGCRAGRGTAAVRRRSRCVAGPYGPQRATAAIASTTTTVSTASSDVRVCSPCASVPARLLPRRLNAVAPRSPSSPVRDEVGAGQHQHRTGDPADERQHAPHQPGQRAAGQPGRDRQEHQDAGRAGRVRREHRENREHVRRCHA